MNSLREIIESSPSVRHLAFGNESAGDDPQSLAPARWDWSQVRRVLVVRLRSIGDTVLTTPALFALRRFLPVSTQVDILLEDWVAPVLDGSDLVNRVIPIARDSTTARARVARELRASRYDVVYNLHGGTTATLLTRATGAKHRVGFEHYQYARLHTAVAPSPLEIWQRPTLHSVEHGRNPILQQDVYLRARQKAAQGKQRRRCQYRVADRAQAHHQHSPHLRPVPARGRQWLGLAAC